MPATGTTFWSWRSWTTKSGPPGLYGVVRRGEADRNALRNQAPRRSCPRARQRRPARALRLILLPRRSGHFESPPIGQGVFECLRRDRRRGYGDSRDHGGGSPSCADPRRSGSACQGVYPRTIADIGRSRKGQKRPIRLGQHINGSSAGASSHGYAPPGPPRPCRGRLKPAGRSSSSLLSRSFPFSLSFGDSRRSPPCKDLDLGEGVARPPPSPCRSVQFGSGLTGGHEGIVSTQTDSTLCPVSSIAKVREQLAEHRRGGLTASACPSLEGSPRSCGGRSPRRRQWPRWPRSTTRSSCSVTLATSSRWGMAPPRRSP